MTTSPLYETKSAWEKYKDQKPALMALAQEYISFISQCKTERETVEYARQKLDQAGFTDNFSTPRVYRVMRGKAIFAARRGSASLDSGLRLIGAHADSPRLDLKQRPFIEQAGVAQAKTHYYGGIRKYQWLARPLALHGIIGTGRDKKVEVSIGENADDPVFCVSDLLPHLAQKQAGQKLSEAFEGEKLNLVIGNEPLHTDEPDKAKDPVKAAILDLIQKKYGVSEEDFITAELEAVPAGPARIVGLDESMLGGYGQDDRICVFCALNAFLNSANSANNMALMLWDKEEIGSDGASGAASRFLEYCMEEMGAYWQPDIRISTLFMNSSALSADVTAALDPDYQEFHEKQNSAMLGYGPCFSKFTGSRGKYEANDADAEYYAALRELFNKREIPWQSAELGKVDLGGGGTIAKFLAAYGMNVIDLGPALLSMHSPFELASVADLYATRDAYMAFFEEY